MALSQLANVRWDPQVTSPFASLSRRVYPRTLLEVFAWGEELWLHHGLYSSAIQKAVRYFLTNVEIYGQDLDYKTREKYMGIINDRFNLVDEAAPIGDEYMAFGNVFTSMHMPFSRSLSCKKCGFTSPLSQMRGHYVWDSGQATFGGACPSCRDTGVYAMRDIPLSGENGTPVITRWPPQFMGIKWHPITQRKQFILNVDQYSLFSLGIKTGDPLYLEDTPWELIQAVCSNKRFEFEDGQIYHMAHPVLSTTIPNMKGWGLPPFMAAFETALLVMMLDKFTEAVVMDYLIPFRMLSPPAQAAGSQAGDPLLGMNGGDFAASMMSIVNRHRRNPTDWNVFPFPVEYQTIGGEANNLVPVQMQEHFESRLLHCIHVPSAFQNAKAQANAGQVVDFKMFERDWQHFTTALNGWLTWVVQRQGELLKWEKASARMITLSMAEDPQIREIKLNLAASNKASMTDCFLLLGMDWKEQQKKVFEEQAWMQEELAEQQDEQSKADANRQAINVPSTGQNIQQMQQMQQQQQGAPGGGAGPMQGAPPQMPQPADDGRSSTIDKLLADADQYAQQLFSADALTRSRGLSTLKHSRPELYAQVKANLAEMESLSKQQGVQMARSGQVPPPQMPAPQPQGAQ